MHAAVRHLIEHDPAVAQTCDPSVTGPHWCHAWGVPINQEDLLGTLMTFTVVVSDSLRRLGVPLSDDDAGAYLHAWTLIGHLIGIRDDLLPHDLADAEQAWAAIRKRQTATAPRGWKDRRPRRPPPGADAPGATPPPAYPHPLPGGRRGGRPPRRQPHEPHRGRGVERLRRATALVGRDAEHDRVVRRLGERLGRLIFEAFLVAERGGRRASFALPDELADR